jgi:S-adenosylmethionine:tRNA ribosyltransferase-isomerase
VHGLLTADYDFALPTDRIARNPAEPRDSSRLMILDRRSGTITHARFTDLVTLIPPGDVLALNTTRVFRARLLGTRDSGAPAEILLLRGLGEGLFEAMVSPGGKLRPGRTVHIAPAFTARIVSLGAGGTRVVHLSADTPIDEAIDRYGHVPLPPYLGRPASPADAERYQTVYARERGSAAAPTAGLHFTAGMLDSLAARGVRRADVLLHIGVGTFRPVDVPDPAHHTMHEEWFEISVGASEVMNDARARGAGVWAVGTTAARAIESAAAENGTVAAGSNTTRIFIRPPYAFRAVDHLVTNFHLPRSTLLMLVAALAGFELTMRAYHEAIAAGYRFYSYGDAMVII